MAVPSATALVEGVKIKIYDASELPVTVSLTGSGTETPTGYEWSILRDRKVNPGGVPQDSGVVSGTHGNFTDGLSTTQNPSITLDVTGAYKFSLRAENGEGWSDPSYVEGDGEDAECIVIVRTEYGNKLPAPNHFRYEYIMEELLRTLEQNSAGASSAIYIPSLWVKPETVHAEDDEFESETLSGWTESFTVSSSAIDPYAKFASGDPRRIVHTEPYRSWYLIQPPADGVFHRLHKPITIPTNAFFWFRARIYDRFSGLAANDAGLLFMISASSGGVPDSTNSIGIHANESDGTFQIEAGITNDGTPTTVATLPDRHQKGQAFEYFGLAKVGTTWYFYGYTDSGQIIAIGNAVYTGAGTLDRVAFSFRNSDSSSDPGNAMMGVDFFRMVESSTYFPGYGALNIPGANYSKPENIPVLSYSSASVVNVQSAPGASSTLRANLNDGVRRTATSPLTVDLTESGRGGLDTGTEATSTRYYIYLVPNAVGTGLSAVASETDPDGGGPTGFSASRYIGAIYNNSSGDILKFYQVSSAEFEWENDIQPAAQAGWGTTLQDPKVEISIDDAVPLTASAAFWYASLRITSPGTDSVSQAIYVEGSSDTHEQIALVSNQNIRMNGRIALPGTSSKKIGYRTWQSGTGGTIGAQNLGITGYIDGYLSSSEAQLQAVYTPDTKTPQGTWATAGAEVDFDARPGQLSTSLHTFQDGLQRSMTTGTWAIANGVAMWGYDEAGSQGNDKWLYFYLVPITDSTMGVIASDNDNSVGPAGYSNYKICWKTYITSGALVHVVQNGNVFDYVENADGNVYSGNGAGYIENETSYAEVSLTSVIPVGATKVQWRNYIQIGVENPESKWAIHWSLDGTNQHRVWFAAGDISVGVRETVIFDVCVTSSRSIYRKRERTQGSADLTWITYEVNSWYDDEIDGDGGGYDSSSAFSYLVEDNFSDSSIHPRWTVVTPGSSTVVEGSDGIVLTCDGDNDPYIEMDLPAYMAERNWVAQVHITFSFSGSPGDGGADLLRINGQGDGAAKLFQAGTKYDSAYKYRVSDSSGNSDMSGFAAAAWVRLRRFGDEIRTDYYVGAHTVDVDGEGRWREYDSTFNWYVVPKSGTFNYPTMYETLQLAATQFSANPGVIATFRKFKLMIF